MHMLHRILVKVSNCTPSCSDRKEKIYNIRSFAALMTEDYFNQVYDWRKTETAGRWSDIYPENIIFASDDIDCFVKEIDNSIKIQSDYADSCLSELKNHKSTLLSIDDLVEQWKNLDAGRYDMYHYYYYFKKLADVLYGSYTFDSAFYDTETQCAKVDKQTIKRIRNNPEDYALVFFDYHY